MSEVIHLTLPLPLSVNQMYKPYNSRGMAMTRRTKEAQEYEFECGHAILQQGKPKAPDGPLRMDIWFYPKTKHRADLDNMEKGIIDAVSRTMGFDDSVITEKHSYKLRDKNNPRCEMEIRQSEYGKES